jgi:hypothetical protein
MRALPVERRSETSPQCFTLTRWRRSSRPAMEEVNRARADTVWNCIAREKSPRIEKIMQEQHMPSVGLAGNLTK